MGTGRHVTNKPQDRQGAGSNPNRPLWRLWYHQWQTKCWLQPEPVPIASRDPLQPGQTHRKKHQP